MTPPPRPFRLVWRAFEAIEYDPAKSDEVLEVRGFDLSFASYVFPGFVLEREDTRKDYGEPRFRVIGEVMGRVLVVIYTRRGNDCRLITAWEADDWEREMWHERHQ